MHPERALGFILSRGVCEPLFPPASGARRRAGSLAGSGATTQVVNFLYITPRRGGAPASLGPGLRTASGARGRWIQQCKKLSPSTTGYRAKTTSEKYPNPTRSCTCAGQHHQKMWPEQESAFIAARRWAIDTDVCTVVDDFRRRETPTRRQSRPALVSHGTKWRTCRPQGRPRGRIRPARHAGRRLNLPLLGAWIASGSEGPLRVRGLGRGWNHIRSWETFSR